MEKKIEFKNAEQYADPTAYSAVKNIVSREREKVHLGGVYGVQRGGGRSMDLLVVAKNYNTVIAVLVTGTDGFGNVCVSPGNYAAVEMLQFAFLDTVGDLLYDVEPGIFAQIKRRISEMLNLTECDEVPAERMLVDDAVIKTSHEDEIGTKATVFREITENMVDTFKRKNHDYGDSYAKLRSRFPQSILIRLADKLNRIETLMTGTALVKDESIEDTLQDLSTYSVMELMERKIEGGK